MGPGDFFYSKDENTFSIMNQNDLNTLSLGSYRALIMIYVLSLNVPNSPPVVPNNPPTGGYYYLCFIDEGTNAQRESHWAKARQLKSRKPGFEPQSVTLALTHHLMTTCGA